MSGQESLGDAARRLREQKKEELRPGLPKQMPRRSMNPEQTIGKSLAQDYFASGKNIPRLVAEIETVTPEEYMQTVLDLFANEDFAALDAIAHHARDHRTRFPGGGWKLYTFYVPLCPRCAGASADQTVFMIESLKRWVAQRPQSITSRVALAQAYSDYAWQARGDSYADTVNDADWKPFRERLETAREVLQKASLLKEKCPHWFVVMQKVGRGQGWDVARLRKVMEDSSVQEPLYYYSYDEFAFTLQPQWMGTKVGDSEKFADEIAKKLGGKDGAEIYFKTATQLDPRLMSWERIREGYDITVERYGASYRILSQIAKMASIVQDRQAAMKYFLQIGSHWDPTVWGSEPVFQNARQWANEFPDSLREKWIEWTRSTQFPEGALYFQKAQSEFSKRNASAIESCKTADSDLQPFQIAVMVDTNGAGHDAQPWPPTSFSECLLPKLDLKTMPKPPHDSYWMFLSVNFNADQILLGGQLYPDVGY